MATRADIAALPTLAPRAEVESLNALEEEKGDSSPPSKEGSLHKSEGPSYSSVIPQHPWRIKGPAILLTLFLTREFFHFFHGLLLLGENLILSRFRFIVGSNFASSSISPLKSTIRKELGVNNAQYADVSFSSRISLSLVQYSPFLRIDRYRRLTDQYDSSYPDRYRGRLLWSSRNECLRFDRYPDRNYPLRCRRLRIKLSSCTRRYVPPLYAILSSSLSAFVTQTDIFSTNRSHRSRIRFDDDRDGSKQDLLLLLRRYDGLHLVRSLRSNPFIRGCKS